MFAEKLTIAAGQICDTCKKDTFSDPIFTCDVSDNRGLDLENDAKEKIHLIADQKGIMCMTLVGVEL